MSLSQKDEFGVLKIFSDDSQSPKFVKFDIGKWGENSGDRQHFAQLRYSSTKDGKPTTAKNSVVSTRWTKIGQGFVDQEVTGYFFLSEIESDKNKEKDVAFKKCGKGSSVTIKLRGGKHPKNSGDPDSAKCYNFDFQYMGGNCNNFQKEYPHPDYYKMSVDTKFALKDNVMKWVGYKAVTINQVDGVRCLAFVDYGSEVRKKEEGPELENQQWKLYFDVTDDGKLHKKYEIKSPKGKKYQDEKRVSEPYKTHFKDLVTQFRMDRIVQPEAKFLSIRSISAGLIDDILKKY